jgi:site-specific DNA-methyltransferase (adenine-specific)
MEKNVIYNEDCLIGMDKIPDNSIDCIICDLPYGLFGKYKSAAWDQLIPMDKLWNQYKRIRKDDCPIILFGAEPFSSHLRLSNETEFRYDYIWKKKNPQGFQFCRFQPLREHEMISVFYKKSKILNQQNLVKLDKPVKAGRKNKSIVGGLKPSTGSTGMKDENRLSYFTGYQRSILEIDNWAEHGTSRKYQHPT